MPVIPTSSPRVTVVVPSLSRQRFLERRLRSIMDQTFQDFEVVFVSHEPRGRLSHDVIGCFWGDARIRVVAAPQCKTVLQQCARGVALSQAEYIWFANCADWTEKSFLMTLVRQLDRHPQVGLSFCRSLIFGAPECEPYCWVPPEKQASEGRWGRDFVANGREELTQHFIRHGYIPCASSVVFRRSSYLRAGRPDASLRFLGEYGLWANMMAHADVGYVAEPLNHWFLHNPAAYASRGLHNGAMTFERLKVLANIRRLRHVPVDAVNNQAETVIRSWLMDQRGPPFDIPLRQHARIFLAALSATPGGLRTFYRLAMLRFQRQ